MVAYKTQNRKSSGNQGTSSFKKKVTDNFESLSSGDKDISEIEEKESQMEDYGYKSDNIPYSALKQLKENQID